MPELVPRGVRKVSEAVLQNGRALILTEEDADKLDWSVIPVGSIKINPQTGLKMVKLEGESDWIPDGIKNDGTIAIVKDARIISETFTIEDPDITLENGKHGFRVSFFKEYDDSPTYSVFQKDDDGNFVFDLQRGSYVCGRNFLEVIIDDVLHRDVESGGLTEVNTHRFALADSLEKGQEVTVKYYALVRIGNPYPRVYINNNIPDDGEEGDIWIDADGTLDDKPDDEKLENDSKVGWERITNKPENIAGYGITDPISMEGHHHSKKDIVDFPSSLPANGGNSNTVANKRPNNNLPNTLAILDASGKLPGSNLGAHKHQATDILNLQPFTRGMIMQWYGTANTVPDGWAICNGRNGTPNLQDRFVIGAGFNYEMGSTGGTKDLILTKGMLPEHRHTLFAAGGTDDDGHDKVCFAVQTIRDCISGTVITNGVYNEASPVGASAGGGGRQRTNTGERKGSPYLKGSWGSGCNSNGGITTQVPQIEGQDPLDITPPYCALYYIMKL